MAFGDIVNFSYSTVLVTPHPAFTGNQLTLATGGGAYMPPVPFYATVWPKNTVALKANAEIILVTHRSGDVLTILRGQEDSSPRGMVAGDQLAASFTAQTLDNRIMGARVYFDTLYAAILHAASHTDGTDDIQDATAAQKGLATAAQIAKLDGIEAGADVTDEENVADAIFGTVAKTALADEDDIPILDSGAAYALSRILYKDLRKVRTKTVTNTYTMDTTTTDEVIICNRPTAFNLTLVDATAGVGLTHRGRQVHIKNIGAGTVSILSAAGSQIFTIEAEASIDLLTGDAAAMVCDGTYWHII